MNKLIKICICFIFLTLSFSSQVKADMGPKPTLKIIVSNAPEEEYYLDLLVDYPSTNTNIWLDKEEAYDENKLDILRAYRDGEWRAAHLTGTYAPISGNLIGEVKGDKVIHQFGYVGIPKKFRIVILTKDNNIIASEEVTTKAFDEVINYDFSTNTVSQRSVFLSYTKQFIYTCFFTLLIEGVALVAAGFSLKENLKAFLFINIATQIFLNVALSYMMIIYGTIGAFVFYIPVELIIFIVEIILFKKFLEPNDRGKIISYTVTANLLSFALGVVLVPSVFFIPFGY